MFKKKKNDDHRVRQPIRSVPERRDVFSYHASRSTDRTEGEGRHAEPFAPAKPDGPAWWKQLPIFIAILIILVCGVDLLLLSTNPRVVSLSSNSNQVFLRPTSDYQQAAQKLLNQSLLNRNKLTVDTVGVTTALEKQFPELSQVSIALPLVGHRPVVYVAPETPALILASQNGNRYIVSQTGKALIATSDVAQPSALNLSVVTDQSGLKVTLGQGVLPSANVSFIQTVEAQLQAQQIPISSLVLPAGGGEFDVYLTGKPYFVKFNLEGQVDEQVGTFIATQKYLDGQHVTPAQYIDARVPGRSYYK